MSESEDAAKRFDYIFVNLDKRQIGRTFLWQRNTGHFGVPHGDGLAEDTLTIRLMDPTCRCVVPSEWVPVCSSNQQSHLGALNIPGELHDLILGHVRDVDTVISFACAHNLFAECALRRLSMMLAVGSRSVWGSWAGDRVLALSAYHPSGALLKDILTAEEIRELSVGSSENPASLLRYLGGKFSRTRDEDHSDGLTRDLHRRRLEWLDFWWRGRAFEHFDSGVPFDTKDCSRAIRYLEFAKQLPLTKTQSLKYADELPTAAQNSKITPVLLNLDLHEFVRLQHVADVVDMWGRDTWHIKGPRSKRQAWTASESICVLVRSSWTPINRMRITLWDRFPLAKEGGVENREWRDISDELAELICDEYRKTEERARLLATGR
ncbi:hypothetical protein PENSPDRAFT_755324 [Peniophora sp. CONT]|nr:hypothetical protein PENSPDRAFT_755324 [Peniophora sp. CONT]